MNLLNLLINNNAVDLALIENKKIRAAEENRDKAERKKLAEEYVGEHFEEILQCCKEGKEHWRGYPDYWIMEEVREILRKFYRNIWIMRAETFRYGSYIEVEF
jgi:Leu/Phe-tRNA-protein transferase